MIQLLQIVCFCEDFHLFYLQNIYILLLLGGLMLKDELKKILEEYKYDYQYLKEKSKEVEEINSLIRSGKNYEYVIVSQKYEEKELSELVEKKKYVESLLKNLGQPYRTIMYMKYITFLTFDEIAYRMNYSTKRIYQLHSEGITILLKKINEPILEIGMN